MRSRFSCSVFLFTVAALAAAASALRAADAGMVNLLTADAKVVTGIDFDRSRNSPFGQYFLSQMTTKEDGLQKFAEMTGFDPRRDLQEIVIASTDGGLAMRSGAGAVMIVRGNFNPAKILQLASAHGGSEVVTSYNGTQVIQTSRGDQKSGELMWAGFLGNLVVAGPKASVQKAIDRFRGATKADAALAARIQSASARHDAWMLTTLSPAALAGNLNNQNMQGAMRGDIMQGIESMTAGVKFGANVVVSGEATTRSDKDASALVDVLRFFSSMAQGNGAKTGAMGLLDAVQMNAEGRSVKFSLTAPSQEFEKLFAPQMNRMKGRVRSGATRLD